MDEPHDRNEPLSETDYTSAAPQRRKWQTPRVLLADRNITRFDCMANHDGSRGMSS